jgi:COP9 signalosome complex subunit 2
MFDQLEKMVGELKGKCKDPQNPNMFDMSKGDYVLEVLALEIQMCIEKKEQRRMKQVFQTTEQFTSTIEDPRVVGIIKECGGKMYMSEKKWKEALQQFWDSFTSMVDSGHPRAVTVLKYVILTQLLSQSDTEYLTQREAKIFANDPSIVAMVDLKEGVEKNDIQKILNVLADKKVNLLEDQLIKQYLSELLRSVRLKALESICAPYKAVRLEFLSKQMDVDIMEIRSLLAELILEERIQG